MKTNEISLCISNTEKKLNYTFKNKDLLLRALTHSSYSFDNRLDYDYERLEFLGDAVVSLIVSEYILKKYSSFNEGDLSLLRAYIVSSDSLYDAAKKIELDNNMFIGKSEFYGANKLKKSIIGDIFEAVIAAVYLDASYEKAKEIVLNLLGKSIETAVRDNSFQDSKSYLQEICQKHFAMLPEYTLISSVGPDHLKTFTVEVDVCGKFKTKGVGKSKKEAEKQAAALAINKFKNSPISILNNISIK